jgi:hypothetical protein
MCTFVESNCTADCLRKHRFFGSTQPLHLVLQTVLFNNQSLNQPAVFTNTETPLQAL